MPYLTRKPGSKNSLIDPREQNQAESPTRKARPIVYLFPSVFFAPHGLVTADTDKMLDWARRSNRAFHFNFQANSTMTETSPIWFNGKLRDQADCTVHVLSHALHYGSSVFEGIRAYETPSGTIVFRLKDHLKRLRYSAMCTAFH